MLTAIDRRQRPPMVLRVGITGTRDLPAPGSAALETVRTELDRLFAQMTGLIQDARREDRASHGYDLTQAAQLRCLSPLAVGADRLFAKVALDHAATEDEADIDLRLEVVIPFASDAYKKTFAPDGAPDAAHLEAEFDDLVARADGRVLQLDGDAGDAWRHASYEAAGRTIARNVDLLIAIWDEGVDSGKRGGTRDTVRFAARAGVPIWSIDAKGVNPPRFIYDPLETFGDYARTEADQSLVLARYVRCALAPPPDPVKRRWYKGNDRDPIRDYFEEDLTASRRIWLLRANVMTVLHRCAIWLLRHPRPMPEAPPRRLGSALIHPWARLAFDPSHRVTNQLAQSYQNRYRTGYFFVVIGSAVALLAAIVGLALGGTYEIVAAVVEFVILGLIATIVWLNWRYSWHERYVDYRLLSEANRHSGYFQAVAWSPPFGDMRDRLEGKNHSWLAWLTTAAIRAEALPVQAMPSPGETRDRIAHDLLEQQIQFHETRGSAGENIGRLFLYMALLSFGCASAFVIGKLGLIPFLPSHDAATAAHGAADQAHGSLAHDMIWFLSLLTAFFSTLSASLFAFKGYEEFEPLAELSHDTIGLLRHAQARMARMDMAQPLSSQHLARELSAILSTLQVEVSGWGQLFRWKPVEA